MPVASPGPAPPAARDSPPVAVDVAPGLPRHAAPLYASEESEDEGSEWSFKLHAGRREWVVERR